MGWAPCGMNGRDRVYGRVHRHRRCLPTPRRSRGTGRYSINQNPSFKIAEGSDRREQGRKDELLQSAAAPVGVPPPQGYPAEGYAKDAYPPPGYPPAAYPQQGYPPPYAQPPPQQQQQQGPSFLEGCLAALCCCCLLDACF